MSEPRLVKIKHKTLHIYEGDFIDQISLNSFLLLTGFTRMHKYFDKQPDESKFYLNRETINGGITQILLHPSEFSYQCKYKSLEDNSICICEGVRKGTAIMRDITGSNDIKYTENIFEWTIHF